MANRENKKLRFMALSTVALAATSIGAVGTGCSGGDGVASVECESVVDYYAFNVHETLMSKCFGCHNASGVANGTDYVLRGPSEPGFIQQNLETIKGVASFESEGQSQFLLKPTQSVPHEGGAVLDPNSDDYKRLLGLIVRLKNDEPCDPTSDTAFTGLELANPVVTLRKAAIILVGRLPTEEEVARVQEGGFAALDGVLDEMMTEPLFLDYVKTTYGDLFQTDFYIRNDASDLIEEVYAGAGWMENDGTQTMVQYNIEADEMRLLNDVAIAREPLELIAHVVKNDLPFTEILTADYSVFSPLSAKTYAADMLEDFTEQDPMEFRTGHYPQYTGDDGELRDFPHAGVLTAPAFLQKWPTTATNVNRARARVFLLFFQGLDILKTAEQPVDQTKVTKLNPTLNASECNVCHSTIDPIAGAFQSFHRTGDEDAQTLAWLPSPDWYPEMAPAGYNGKELPLSQAAYGLPWLAKEAVKDDKFALGAVFNAYRGLTMREPLIAPEDFSDPLYDAQFKAFMAQSNTFANIAAKFKASNYNFKVIVKELIMSPYFRAINSVKLSEEDSVAMTNVGFGHLLTPERLHRKIQAVLGIPWNQDGNSNPYLTHDTGNLADVGQLQTLYGGVDFVDTSVRNTDPNGIMASVVERMSIQMACRGVAHDFAEIAENRFLFPPVEVNGEVLLPEELTPESGGLEVPAAIEGIKRTIQHLHKQVLGEDLPLDHAEIEATYQLFVETWRAESPRVGADMDGLPTDLPGECQVTEDFYSGQALPEDQHVVSDDNYVLRSWMAVMTYLLSDYRFIYE
ncbi:MAG: hypothetical protein R3B72_16415 [Polyangiaceae bacterium]